MATRRPVVQVTPEVEVVGAPYHTKYRPTRLSEVVGQDDVVKSIEGALKAKARQHTYFLFGPGGTGKTTLARIIAAEFKCSGAGVIEVDAASNSGIDEMRKVTEAMRYAGFGDQPNKAYIIDECHRLSKQAWDSLLKSTEEPPAHVFFFFCSSEPGKIPKPMLTRGPNYILNPVRFDPLMDLLEWVCKEEKLETPTWVLETVAKRSDGSPRAALVMLAMVQDAQTDEGVDSLLQGVGEIPEVIDLCRAMLKGELDWGDVQRGLAPIADQGAEGIRIQVSLYLAAVLMGNNTRNVGHLLDMLAAFHEPCNPTDKLAPLLLAFGKFARF